MVEASPFPIPPDVRSLVVFGGTFDPPTRAHVDLAIAARDALGSDWLLYVPAAQSPLKAEGPEAGNAARIDMLQLALRGQERVSISTYELEAPGAGPSYTLSTLEHLREHVDASCSMRLLIGADQAASFHRWRQPRRVIELCEPVVMLRSPVESVEALVGSMSPHWAPADVEAWRGRVVNVPRLDVSATSVRELLSAPAKNRDELMGLLPDGVLDYIIENDLYSA